MDKLLDWEIQALKHASDVFDAIKRSSITGVVKIRFASEENELPSRYINSWIDFPSVKTEKDMLIKELLEYNSKGENNG